MLDIESPPISRITRNAHQEKRLRKRRELDALVKDVGGGRRRRKVGANEELLSKDDTSSDSGEGRIHEGVGVTVWRSARAPRHYTVWWGLKWGLGIGTIFLLASITVWLHVSTRFELDVVRKHIVRVDDDSKSIPETLQLLQSKLQTLQNNQSEVQLSLGALNKAVTGLQERLDRVNTSLQREGLTQGGDGQVKQSLADLGVRVSEIRQGLELASNTSSKNSASISMITTELNSIKLNNIDLRNGGGSPKVTPSPSPAEPNPELTRLNDTIKVHNQRLNNLNNTLLSVAQNSTVMIDWVKQDVVALQGKVSQLQDDNQNVSSRLTSLSEKCSSQFMTSLSNISSLQSAVEKLESQMKQLKSADSLLITPNQVLPLSASESPPPAKPPGLAPPLNLQPSTEGQSVGSNLKNTEVEAKKRPRDKRQSSDPGLKP